MSANDTTPVLRGGPPPVFHQLPSGRLGKYRLLGLLGRGGMGAVFEAEDPVLGRRVALKVMLPEVAAADPRARDRFVREAQTQAKVEHDHVVPIFEVGEERGVPYLTMPLLKGITLASALVANPRPPLRAVLRIARQAAEGLAAAHAAGLVHRDIKPGNIWLEDPRMRVKVLDFGLARRSGPDADESPAPWSAPPTVVASDALTAVGTVVGTPYYMSPEQARGDALDPRSDVFSLGIVLYEMTTGRSPFPGASTRDVLRELAATDPPPPLALVPDLPPALSALVVRMLAKDPADRPPTAAEVAAELRAVELGVVGTGSGSGEFAPLAGAPNPWQEITATVPIDPEPAPPRRPRVPTAVWAGLALAAAGLAGLAAALAPVFAARGELVVESDLPAVEIVVKRGGVVVRGPTRDRRFVLPPAEYAVEAVDAPPNLKVLPAQVAVARDGRETVWVWAERPRPAPPRPPRPDRERETASALLPDLREMVVRLDTGVDRYVSPSTPLPNEPFTVTAVWFPVEGVPADATGRLFLPAAEKLRGLVSAAGPLRPTPAQLERLALTPSRETIDTLQLEFDPGRETVALLALFPNLVQVSFDAGGAAAARLPALAGLPPAAKEVFLVRLPAGAALPPEARAGLAGLPRVEALGVTAGGGFDRPLADAVVGMPGLKVLRLTRTPADPAAVASLARAPALAELTLTGTGLTDAHLPALDGLTTLRKLDLRGTAVTTDAVTRLWGALPRCEVLWNGGALRPRP